MVIKWRVVAIDSTGARIIVDEGLTEERAHEIRDVMIEKGHNVMVEAESQSEFDATDGVKWSTGTPVGRRENISLVDTPAE